ncbi:UDP-2,4-diacetamido-2,4,6-trideoxy-beta-L-altropyranose hydrolase [Pseudomonas silesiensis]|uniref:UDP-2,4-diacetamido-2,4, 6-trideoxy-beta-L-altropyranose hydrolase n=1 Tax=Pseudomonas silesiensis TaxID=1853130 RepID=UPI000ADC91B2
MQPLKVAFRVDASLQIGTGHVMRCLTLADALKLQGSECQFICREHPGNLIDHILSKGFQVHVLPLKGPTTANLSDVSVSPAEPQPAHATWLGSTQEEDADKCTAILSEQIFDWLIVDHYALDARWETALKAHYQKLMVIDDLADRPHQCDLLLDQTFGRDSNDYTPWVPDTCTLLCGSEYSLLRPEFAALRCYSLQRRRDWKLEHLLITMGGVDKDNATGQILEALKSTKLPDNCHITVVMGATAPWLEDVRLQALQMPWPTTVKAGISDMAQLMADSDLAIGAAGATSWERCCLGLPTLMLVLAANQRKVAHGLEHAGAVQVLQGPEEISTRLPHLLNELVSSPCLRERMSRAATEIADGHGVASIIQQLGSKLTANVPTGSRVRSMTREDLELVLGWRNHDEVRRYMYTQDEISLADHTRWFEKASQDASRHLLIFEDDGVPLGFINIHKIAPGGIADWGFYAAPEAPRGTGRRLGEAALQYAFSHAALHKICGQALSYNERSIKFHLKLGFQQEGSLREQHFDGQRYQDVVCFGLLATDWQANN